MAQYIKVVQNIFMKIVYENEFLIRFYDNVGGFIDAREKLFLQRKFHREERSCLAAVALFS